MMSKHQCKLGDTVLIIEARTVSKENAGGAGNSGESKIDQTCIQASSFDGVFL